MRKKTLIKSVGAIILLLAAGYWYSSRSAGTATEETTYTLAAAEMDTVILSVETTGQVAAATEAVIRPEKSGKVTSVLVAKGQNVKAGDVLFRLDSSDLGDDIQTAQDNLDSALLSLEKIQEPPTNLEKLKAQNTLTQAEENVAQKKEALDSAIQDAYEDVSAAYLDLPGLMTDMEDILYGTDSNNNSSWNIDYYTDLTNLYDSKADDYRLDTKSKYDLARNAFATAESHFRTVGRTADKDMVNALLGETNDVSLKLDAVIRSADLLIRLHNDVFTIRNLTPASTTDEHLGNLDDYVRSTSSIIQSMQTALSSIASAEDSIITAERSLEEKRGDYEDMFTGPDELDVKTQEMTISQRRKTLANLKSDYADFVSIAPFDGVVSDVGIKIGDTVGTGTDAVTIITKSQVAEVSFGELDAAGVRVGQRATLTFDAIEDLAITGEVIEVDVVGTSSQSVVTYGAKVALDYQDERVKPGMTVTASVITETSVDVLTVPTSAIKTTGDMTYVNVIAEGYASEAGSAVYPTEAIVRKTITVGLEGDSLVEITSGLTAGEFVITRTVTNQAANASSSNKSGGAGMMMGGMSGPPGM